jgi:hypothetical protein
MKKIYVAYCIEHGERFTSTFMTSETNKQKLAEMGEEMASEWGAECTSVKQWKPKTIVTIVDTKTGKNIEMPLTKWLNFDSGSIQLKDNDTGKLIPTTMRKYNNWLGKHPNMEKAKAKYSIVSTGSTRYKEVSRSVEKPENDIWDCDKSSDENLKNYKKCCS